MNEILAKPLFSIGATEITMGKALLVLVVVLATLLVARWVRRLTIRHFERHDAGDEAAVLSSATLIAFVILLIGLELTLHILGIRLTALFAAGGLLALGAGLAVKNIVENFLSGIVLRVDRTVRAGDIVELDDQWLRIQKVGVRTTSATTATGAEIMIPNATVAQSTVTSLTRQDFLYRVETSIPVTYSADLEEARRTLEDAAASLEWRSRKEDPRVFLAEFTRYNAVFHVFVLIDDLNTARQRRSDLNEALWQGLEKAGIEMVAT